MSRFEEQQHPLFRRLNSSLDFDRRLGAYDVAQSRAHARALRKLDVLDDDELRRMLEGLDAVAAELEDGSFPFQPQDEDIHMAIERRLTELIGPMAGKLHTARSRNDQVATDLAMFIRDHSLRAVELLGGLSRVVLRRAEEHRDWPAPGYTHLQRAQPVYLGHHLLAYLWMFVRDARRFQFAAEAAAELPGGAGALAGVNWDLDREAIATELGFDRPVPNSLDAVSNRDFALDYLHAASACATHLSRLGAEIVLWSSSEFGFCEPADGFASGSSIMPQKKNPDAAELLRAKAPSIAASLATLTGALHALPLAYSKDLQEDKPPVFEATDTIELCLEAAAAMLEGLRFDRGRLEAAAGDELLAATDLADLLVIEGIPFREAHAAVGTLVRVALERGVGLSELDGAEVAELPPRALERFRELLRERGSQEAKVSSGGTAGRRLEEQLEEARRAVSDLGR